MTSEQLAAPELKPFMVLSELYTRSEEKTRIQLDLLKPVAEYERQQEQCGCYFFLLPSDDEKTIITVLESYDSRDYMTGAHRRSSPFQKLKGFEAKNGTRSQKSLNFIISPSGGFLERETPSNIPVADQYVRIVKMTCSPETRSEAVEVMTDYAQSLYESKTEVLSYMVAMNAESASTFFVFERYPSEMVAKTLASQERGQSVMLKLKDLDVEQSGSGYRAMRGFVSKKEELVCAPFNRTESTKKARRGWLRKLVKRLQGKKINEVAI